MSVTKLDFSKYIGRTVKCDDGQTVKIETISHSFVHRNKAVVNENHFVHYLDFFGQMNGEKITEADKKLFAEAFEDLNGKDTHKTKFEN